MSIGKNSIARAATVNTAHSHKVQEEKALNAPSFTSVSADKIEILDDIDDIDVTALKISISKRGVLVPLLIGVTESGKLWLIDGRRRLEVAKQLGISELPSMVVAVENKAAAARLKKEITATMHKFDNVREEKFRIIDADRGDMPYYLL